MYFSVVHDQTHCQTAQVVAAASHALPQLSNLSTILLHMPLRSLEVEGENIRYIYSML